MKIAVVTLTLGLLCSCTLKAAEQPGRIEFDFDGGPPASVEVDLKQGMLGAFTNIAQSAIEGVSEGLTKSGGSPAIRESTVHLQSAKEVLGMVSQAIREVRVRVYEDAMEPGFT